jgi:hypothetical protein
MLEGEEGSVIRLDLKGEHLLSLTAPLVRFVAVQR